MEVLLRRLSERWAGKKHGCAPLPLEEERVLLKEHLRRFRRRVENLSPAWFPGREKNEEAIESLGGGAFADFLRNPRYDDEPAFVFPVTHDLPAAGFLYYWRNSATMEFLRREGSGELRDRLRLLRNVRIHLRDGFSEGGCLHGEPLWWLPGDSPPPRIPSEPLNLKDAAPCVGRKRGKAAISAILRHAGVPLTQSEICKVLLEMAGLEPRIESMGDRVLESFDTPPDRGLMEADVRARAQKFVRELSAVERTLLITRGYTQDEKPRVSHREVAERLPGRSAETYRLLEHSILRTFAERFPERDELRLAVSVLVSELRKEMGDVGEMPQPDPLDQPSPCV